MSESFSGAKNYQNYFNDLLGEHDTENTTVLSNLLYLEMFNFETFLNERGSSHLEATALLEIIFERITWLNVNIPLWWSIPVNTKSPLSDFNIWTVELTDEESKLKEEDKKKLREDKELELPEELKKKIKQEKAAVKNNLKNSKHEVILLYILYKTDASHPVLKSKSKYQVFIDILELVKTDKKWFLLSACFDVIYTAFKDPLDFLNLVIYHISGALIAKAKEAYNEFGLQMTIKVLFSNTLLYLVGPTIIENHPYELILQLAKQCHSKMQNTTDHVAKNIENHLLLKLNISKMHGFIIHSNTDESEQYKSWFKDKHFITPDIRKIAHSQDLNLNHIATTIINNSYTEQDEIVICITNKQTQDKKSFDFVFKFLKQWRNSKLKNLEVTLIIDIAYSGSIIKAIHDKYENELNLRVICGCSLFEKTNGLLSFLICKLPCNFHIMQHPVTWTSVNYRGSIPIVDYSDFVVYEDKKRDLIKFQSFYKELNKQGGISRMADRDIAYIKDRINEIDTTKNTQIMTAEGQIFTIYSQVASHLNCNRLLIKDQQDTIYGGIQWESDLNLLTITAELMKSLYGAEFVYLNAFLMQEKTVNDAVAECDAMRKELGLYRELLKHKMALENSENALKLFLKSNGNGPSKTE